jgi:hypothetical protein
MVADGMLGAGKVVDYLRDMFDGLLRVGLMGLKWLVDGAIKVGELAAKVPGLSKVLGDDAAAMSGLKDASVFLGGAIKGVEQGADGATAATKALTPPVVGLTEAQKKAAAAAEAHAKAIGNIRDNLFGNGAIKGAKDYVDAIGPLPNLHKMTAEKQADVNKVMDAAIEAYRAQGKVAPQAMRDLYIATVALPAPTLLVGDAIGKVGESVKLTIPPVEDLAALMPKVVTGMAGIPELGLKIDVVPPKVRKTTDSVSELSKSLAQLAQVSGGAFGSMVRDLSSVVAAIDAAEKSRNAFSEGAASFKDGDTLGGILGMSTGIMGIASAAIAGAKAVGGLLANIFGLGTAGRDAVKDFAASFGGFDDLHAKLLTLGAAGEALWVKLTQGVGKNNPEQAKAVIEEINKALAGQDAWMQRLPGLIEKYGLSWEQAGKQANQARLDEIAKGLIQDFADLSHAGFDVTLVTEKMSDGINQYIQDAVKTGTEVPAAMRPLLEKMIEMGKLTDANGNLITSLEDSGISFATTLTEGFKSIVDAIKELTRVLGGIPDKKVVDVEFHGHHTGEWPGDDAGTSAAATGGLVGKGRVIPFTGGGPVFSPIGTDTVPAMLTPGEIVLNAAQQKNIAGAMGGRGQVADMSEMRQIRKDMARMMRDQPRAIAVAVGDAIALTSRRRRA